MLNLLLFNLKTDADDTVLGFTSDWIRALSTKFERIYVLTMDMGRVSLPPNVQVYSVGKERGYGEARRGFEFYRKLIWILSRHRIDVCFAHMMPLFAVMGWPVLRMLRKPILLWYAHKSVTPMLRISERLVDGVVTASRTGFQIPSKKVIFIGHGVDVERFVPAEGAVSCSGPFRFLTLGRLSPIKRVKVLIRAFAEMRRLDPRAEVSLIIAGATGSAADEAYRIGLEAMAAEAGLADAVKFTGGIGFRDVHRLYGEADAFVNTSDTESLDKSILEAMSSGIPIVSSNLAMREVLPPRLAGEWVVDQGDHTGLADRLIRLYRMEVAERRELGACLREVVIAGHSLSSLSQKLTSELSRLSPAG